MRENRSIFYESWRDCLREHYLHVVRTDDSITEASLREILAEIGFTDPEIEALASQGRENPTSSSTDSPNS